MHQRRIAQLCHSSNQRVGYRETVGCLQPAGLEEHSLVWIHPFERSGLYERHQPVGLILPLLSRRRVEDFHKRDRIRK
jgi:hypothetical protein